MLKFNLVTVGDMQNITVLVDGELLTASTEHPNFATIVAAVMDGREDVADLFDMEKAVNKKFDRLSERVAVRNGRVFFDGEEMDNSLTKQIVRFVEEGEEDFMPLVNFMEKVMVNPNANSREQLYEWLSNHEFTITDTGDIVAYKGCYLTEDGTPRSTVEAPEKDKVTVDGEPVTGYVLNPNGATVEMPRSVVDDNENAHCSVGLHVGTYRYAREYASSGTVLEVHVNPRDVVSVTSDSNREKIRTCRYKVVGPRASKYEQAVITIAVEDDVEDEFYDYSYNAVNECDIYGCGCDDDAEVVVNTFVDTRLNYLKQQRYPKGHPKAGQFIPKGATV